MVSGGQLTSLVSAWGSLMIADLFGSMLFDEYSRLLVVSAVISPRKHDPECSAFTRVGLHFHGRVQQFA